MAMNQDVKALWVAALKSGEYEQTTGLLSRVDPVTGEAGYCCLGVLCEVAIKQGINLPTVTRSLGYKVYGEEENGYCLPYEVSWWAGFEGEVNPNITSDSDHEDGNAASFYNDVKAFSFQQIADLIEEHL